MIPRIFKHTIANWPWHKSCITNTRFESLIWSGIPTVHTMGFVVMGEPIIVVGRDVNVFSFLEPWPPSRVGVNTFFSSQSQMLHISENQGHKVFDYNKYTLQFRTIVRHLLRETLDVISYLECLCTNTVFSNKMHVIQPKYHMDD